MSESQELVRVDHVSVLESISRAEIDMQIATAKRYPRDIATVKQEMISLATLDQETAESCFYKLPRANKHIQGPGVRLAEIAVHSFGNIRVQTRVIETVADGKSPHVVVQSVCADLEKNVAVSIEKRRRITGKKLYLEGQSAGNRPPDEDDINLATNACAAIAFRDAAFKVIPGSLIKAAYDAAVKVAIGDAKTLVDRRAEALSRFAKMGVSQDRVLAAVEKSAIDSIDLQDLETLFGLYTAIRDGQTTIDAAFPEVKLAHEAGKVGSRAQRMADKARGSAPSVSNAPAPAPAPAPAESKELPKEPPVAVMPKLMTRDELVAAIMPLAEKSKASQLKKIYSAVGLNWNEAEAWEQSSEDVLRSMLSLLKC